MDRKAYPTDLTDQEWWEIKDLVPAPKHGGRPAIHSRREIVNAMFYVLRTGCAWRMLPHDLPPWQTVYYYFRTWKRSGVFKKAHDALRKEVRQHSGKNPEPSAGVLDSQSVKTSEKGGSQAMTRQRKSKAASGIFWLIHSASCFVW